MRVSLRLVGISAAACVASILAIAACSSSSSNPGGAGGDAGSDARAEASTNDDGGTPPACYVDASLSAFAASDASAAGCAACVQSNCHPAITTCETDCTCITFFTCLADSGVATGLGSGAGSIVNACAGTAVLAVYNNPGVKGLADCLSDPCANACSGILDAGTVDDSATLEAASPTDADTDAGSPVDAAVDGG